MSLESVVRHMELREELVKNLLRLVSDRCYEGSSSKMVVIVVPVPECCLQLQARVRLTMQHVATTALAAITVILKFGAVLLFHKSTIDPVKCLNSFLDELEITVTFYQVNFAVRSDFIRQRVVLEQEPTVFDFKSSLDYLSQNSLCQQGCWHCCDSKASYVRSYPSASIAFYSQNLIYHESWLRY